MWSVGLQKLMSYVLNIIPRGTFVHPGVHGYTRGYTGTPGGTWVHPGVHGYTRGTAKKVFAIWLIRDLATSNGTCTWCNPSGLGRDK